jgi:hypothetical protein
MKNSGHAQNRIEIKVKVSNRYKKNGRTKATNGSDDFGDERPK